jgi:hypothetical protein
MEEAPMPALKPQHIALLIELAAPNASLFLFTHDLKSFTQTTSGVVPVPVRTVKKFLNRRLIEKTGEHTSGVQYSLTEKGHQLAGTGYLRVVRQAEEILELTLTNTNTVEAIDSFLLDW